MSANNANLAIKAICLVFAFFFIEFSLFGQSATISNPYIEFKNEDKLMKIHLKLNTYDVLNHDIRVIAYLECPKGTGVKDVNGKYCTTGGDICASKQDDAPYKNTEWGDFTIEFPYAEIHPYEGKHDYYLCLRVRDKTIDKFIDGGQEKYVSFTMTGSSTDRDVHKECTACHGAGYFHYDNICAVCGGKGFTSQMQYVPSYYGMTPQMINVQCNYCGGSGKSHIKSTCTQCGGSGEMVVHNHGSQHNHNSGGYYAPITPSTSTFSGGNSTNSSSSRSSLYTTCHTCGGSGVCTSCHGKGGEFRDTGCYTGSSSMSWISCPSCNGSGKCFNCYGRGKY